MIAAFDPSELRVIIDEAQDETRSKMKAVYRMISQYHGPFWSEGGEKSYSPENAYFEYITAMVPRAVAHNPRVKAKSRRGGPQQEVASAIENGLNRLVKDLSLSVTLRDLVTDMLFGWGVALVKESPREGMKLAKDHPLSPGIPTWPVVQRLPPRKFFMDPDADETSSCRYMGHEWRMDKDDLIDRAKDNPDENWDMDAVNALAISVPREMHEEEGATQRTSSRKEIQAFDVWFPEIELEDSPGASEGFYGTIFTIAVSSTTGSSSVTDSNGDPIVTKENKQGFLREPRPFAGPRTGPYAVFGCYRVPDSPYPLSPLVATEGQIKDLNKQVLAADASMERHKRIIGVPDNSTAQKMKRSMHDWIVAIPYEGDKPLAVELEIGGHTDKQLETIMMKKERLDRVLGMDETMRGNSQAGVTASSTVLANESAEARISEIIERATEATIKVLESMAHYMFYSDTVVFPMGAEAMEDDPDIDLAAPEYEGLDIEVWFQGGNPDPGKGHTYEDLELDIEPYSMPRTSQGLAQQRMLQTHEMAMSSLPLMEQYFDFPWKEHFKKIGETMNMPNMEDLIPAEMLKRFAAQYEAMTEGQGQGQPDMVAGGSPRLSGQVGGKPKSQAAAGAGPATSNRVTGGGSPGQQSGANTGQGRISPLRSVS